MTAISARRKLRVMAARTQVLAEARNLIPPRAREEGERSDSLDPRPSFARRARRAFVSGRASPRDLAALAALAHGKAAWMLESARSLTMPADALLLLSPLYGARRAP
jgi:hypothetical protein